MNLSKVIKKNWDENKGTYITAGVLIGVGFVIGTKHRQKIDVMRVTRSLDSGRILAPNLFKKYFPMSMSLNDIKSAALTIDGAKVSDALVVTIEGLPMLFVR